MTQVIIGIDPGTNVTGYGIIKMSPHAKEPIEKQDRPQLAGIAQ